MNVRMKKLSALSIVIIATILSGAKYSEQNCQPKPPVNCNPDDCNRCYCLGPENYAASPPVGPKTCNGDISITVAGFYWNAHQEGTTYAIEIETTNTLPEDRINIRDARYKRPHFDWDFGFKIGIGYTTACDGWDVGVLWTKYKGKGFSHDEAESDDNVTLLPLWSDFAPDNPGFQGGVILPVFATDIQTFWKLDLNLVDIELGRDFWNSKRLAIRPHVGLRVGFVDQEFELHHKGGSWSPGLVNPGNTPLNNEVKIENDFKGVGMRVGINTSWNFICGWSLYANAAYSLLYGRFDIDHREFNRLAVVPFTKSLIFDTEDHFRTSKPITDLAIGIQWGGLFCKCKYGIQASLGWEQHLFLNQNQMWSVVKTSSISQATDFFLGTNDFNERRGDLSTQGWTLTIRFDF